MSCWALVLALPEPPQPDATPGYGSACRIHAAATMAQTKQARPPMKKPAKAGFLSLRHMPYAQENSRLYGYKELTNSLARRARKERTIACSRRAARGNGDRSYGWIDR